MTLRLLVLPAMVSAGTVLLLAPARPLRAFTKTGDVLGEGQRDVRLYNNFTDLTANDNTNSPAEFPGWDGAELAIWKAIVEWGSGPHGNGTGDPQGGNVLGSGEANFDALWSGNAAGIGNTNHNIVSSIGICGGGGTLAFTELPSSDGWRIRFCENWVWDDGPGAISGSSWDIQGVMTHEYGHAIGLGHSSVSGATMFPSGSPGQTSLRSIAADDIAGIQCVYGMASGAKPKILATVADTGTNTITIHGVNFAATGNEVWFTNATVTAVSIDPIVRVTGVVSSGGGTLISVTIPADASPGDVMINTPGLGGSTLSNAFPTDLVGTFGTVPGPHPDLSSVTPTMIPALIPGTDQSVTLNGTDLDQATEVLLDGVAIDPARYTIVDAGSITLDMPQASSLGIHEIGVGDGLVTDVVQVTIVAPAGPVLEWGNGDALNPVSRSAGLDLIVSGPPGQLQALRGSPLGPPTLAHFRGKPGNPLVDAGAYVIPARGWLAVHLDGLPDPARVGSTWFARSFGIIGPGNIVPGNDQTITLVP